MKAPTASNRYIASALLTFGLLSAGLVTASYLLDPFRLYRWTGSTQRETTVDLFWYMRLHKPYRMEKVAAGSLVLGSSRAARLPPQALDSAAGPGYNASIPGATLYEVLRTLEHAMALSPIHTVVLGLDYGMFRPESNRTLPGFSEARLRRLQDSPTRALARLRQRALDLWNTLFSRGALAADISAARGLQQSKRQFYRDGTWTSGFGREEKARVYALLARQKFEEFAGGSAALDFSILEQIIEFCAGYDIALILLLSPTHAHQMNVIHRAGAWPAYLDYQARVIEIAGNHRDRGANVRVYGLEHQTALVHEPPDARRDWFRDGIHFSRDTGGNIMRCLFARRGCEERRKPMELTGGNAEDYLARVSDNMRNYASVRPTWYARLDRQLQRLQGGAGRDSGSGPDSP